MGYDDTPRRGTEGLVVENTSPQMFGKYLKMLMKNVFLLCIKDVMEIMELLM